MAPFRPYYNRFMCSRFELTVHPREMAIRFALPEAPALANRSEFRPTDQTLVIAPGGVCTFLAWGFAVDWSKSPLINARAETLTEKKTFLPVLENRCIVPASAYFEWRKDGNRRLKNRISFATGEPFAMAGLTDGERFTIVTCPPAATIAHIHNRMPVILDPAAEGLWLDSASTFADVSVHLKTFAGALKAEEESPPAPAQGDLFG